MPDFSAPATPNYTPTPATQTLSQFMGLKQQQQAIQSGALGIQQQQQNLQRGAADTQMTQQSATQRQAIANIDWSKYDDGTGTISTDKMLADKDLQRQAGDQFPQILQTAAAARSTQLDNKQKLVGLNDGLRSQFGSMVGALRTDPDVVNDTPAGRQKVTAAMQQFGQAGGPDAQRVADIYGQVATHAPQGQLVRGISAIQLQAQDASRQAAAQSPNYVNTGGSLVNVNPQAAGGNLSGAPAIGTSLPPQAITDPGGNLHIIGGNSRAPGAPAGAAPSGASPQAPSGNGWVNTPANAGDVGQVTANTQNMVANRNTAADAQIQHDILGRIQQLSSTPGLYLGPGSQQVANLATMVSQLPGMEGAAKYANNYNELTKFMAQNAARMGQSLGLAGSDSRLAMAQHANPNADPMDPRTVQNVAQYMGGIVRMGLAKADAMDNWLKQPGNSQQNEHVFEKLWRDNADPRLFQLAEMKDQGDAENYSRLHINRSELGTLQRKHDVLVQLGALPGSVQQPPNAGNSGGW